MFEITVIIVVDQNFKKKFFFMGLLPAKGAVTLFGSLKLSVRNHRRVSSEPGMVRVDSL